MNNKSTIELKAEHVKYYSQYDEDAFFGWLGKIECVTETGGKGYTLSITVRTDLVDQGAMRDLLALFHRYHIDKSQLLKLVRPEFASWFHDKEKYWNAENS
jgi:hypothetical protein